MHYQFEFRHYQRKFRRSLLTSHGNWDVREGIILRLTDERGRVGWGEIAPLPWFGSETLEQAWDFCRQSHGAITTKTIFSIPAALPACQFGFESACIALKDSTSTSVVEQVSGQSLPALRPPLNKVGTEKDAHQHYYSALLPTGEAALQAWQMLWHQGYRTFKWKIGVAPIQDELQIFEQLMQALPASVKLRLDANAGLNWEQANEWLRVGDRVVIEFLEQPLPVEQFDAMLNLSQRYSTPIALDESVATLEELQTCYQKGWRGLFVIKPAIAGSPSRLRQFCQAHEIDAVFSSVFETEIGRKAALHLAVELSSQNRAVGFGVHHWFVNDDNWLEKLWQSI